MGHSVASRLLEEAVAEGLIQKDPSWKDSLEEPLPAWVVLELALALLRRIDPPSDTYD
ncbi:hypothetical protein [Gorillibacterium sp. CAU 1737]|uniref:hypothetical protein n=1 Tax=Gorillibacterium sp. CAU 1737 TaxID=3140362 RepID=UPI003261AAA0